ncbi:MAG TPA: exonuclease domain-containing protein [Patescibacteria group bacterium]|nr:exonuclease domain-containing protein [Patescibacteria group bacterium]
MYIFYDLETTGLERDFSQILQIGLIFTDSDMNILSMKKLEARVSPWTVPAPGALLTTGFTAADLKNARNSHFELMQEVDQWARSQYWPVVFAGYNNIGYDDDIFAQNLHQNLLDRDMLSAKNPSNGQHNGRFDVMIAVQAAQAYMPGLLKLDVKNANGAPSVKLGVVARQNGVGLSAEEAHDAMNDIKATVGLAKLVKKSAPALWDHLTKLSNAQGVNDFVRNHEVFTHTAYSFGNKNPAAVTSLGARNGSGNTEILFDLSFDPALYMKMSVEELKRAILDQSKKTPKGQPEPLKPFRMVLKSQQPILMPMEMSDPVLPAGFDENLAKARAAMIKADPQFMENVQEAAKLAKAARSPRQPTWTKQPEELMWKEPAPEVKEKLEDWMQEFRETSTWKEAAALVTNFRARFAEEIKQDENITRFVKFAGRIVYENAPEELSVEKQDAMKRYIAQHILDTDPDVPWMTVAKARKELDKIDEDRNGDDPKKKDKWAEVTDTQVRSLKLYYTALEKEYAPYLPVKPIAPAADFNAAAPVQPPVATNDNATVAPKKPTADGFKPS